MNTPENSRAAASETAPADDRSVRPVIEHALTVYFDGNDNLARTLIDRLIAEARNR